MKMAYYIALFGGLFLIVFGLIMFANNTTSTGYDALYDGGYRFNTITPIGMMSIGVFLLLIGISGFLNRFRNKRD